MHEEGAVLLMLPLVVAAAAVDVMVVVGQRWCRWWCGDGGEWEVGDGVH